MKALFMETEAATQCLKYAKDHEWDEEDTQELIDRCYTRGEERRLCRSTSSFSDWLVAACLDGDGHKGFNISAIFTWRDTPEGHEYWSRIHNWG